MSNKINSLDRTAVRRINDDIQSALDTVAKRYGVQIKVGNSRFSNTNCTTKIDISTVNEGGTVMTKEATDFNRFAASFGITKKLGDTFDFRYDTYEIAGLKPRSSKYPVLAKNLSNGKTFKFPANVIN
jgi:hypothetical protein